MDTNQKIVNVSDVNRKRSSLKNPEDMKKIIEIKHKNLQFDLDTIKESPEVEVEVVDEVSIITQYIYL